MPKFRYRRSGPEPRSYVWLPRTVLNRLLTSQLQQVAGCEGASISIGATRDVHAGESNWAEFACSVPEAADPMLVHAVACGVVSEARERFNVLDS